MYRFRSFSQLLGVHQELKKRSIFFAAPEQLNDPMEGFRDVFWSGDFIVWRNLFKHYLMCVERSISLLQILGEDHKIDSDMIPIFGSELDLPTPEYKELFNKVKCNFFTPDVEQYIEKIGRGNKRIRRDELAFHLRNVHIVAIDSTLRAYKEQGLSNATPLAGDPLAGLKYLLESNFFESNEPPHQEHENNALHLNALYKATRISSAQSELMALHKGHINKDESNRLLVFFQFPDFYLNLIESLIYPNWYTACFTANCKNPASWGYYAAGHTGACLKFRTEVADAYQTLSLKGHIGHGSNGPVKGETKFNFHKIEYIDGFGEIDFFRHLGQPSGQTLTNAWYTGEDGAISQCGTLILGADDEWRKQYWEIFYRDITKKTKHWQEESEFRLITSNLMSGHRNDDAKLYTYHSSALEAVIFGIKASARDKVEAIRIVTENCAEFSSPLPKFYQAMYSPQSKSIEHYDLGIS